MKSPIVEPGKSGDTINIKALSRDPGTLDGLHRPMQYRNVFMGYLDNNQFQLNRLHNIAYDTVAPLGIGNIAYHENNNVHRMNNHKWADKDIRLTY